MMPLPASVFPLAAQGAGGTGLSKDPPRPRILGSVTSESASGAWVQGGVIPRGVLVKVPWSPLILQLHYLPELRQ